MATQSITKIDDHIKKLDEAVKEYAIADTFKEANSLSATLKLAEGMITLRSLLTEPIVMTLLMPLRGTKLGFLTDRDSGRKSNGDPIERYGWETVRDVSVEAFMRGFQPINNEFNVIAFGFYAAKNGIDRKLREYKGLTDLEHRPGVPAVSGNGQSALVAYTINYRLNGEPRTFACDIVRDKSNPQLILSDHRIPVRVNANMGPDAVLGKAHRKASALLLANLTGSIISLPVADMDDGPPINTTAEPSPTPAADDKGAQSTAQGSQLDEVLKKHKPAANGTPTPDEVAADERAHAGK